MKHALRKNNLQHPAKGGSTPAFAYQLAAIAPLPYSNLQPYFLWYNFVWIGQFQKMQLQQEKHICKSNLLRRCGLLAHTSPTFLKNCWIKKLSFACGSFFWTVNFCKSNVSHKTNQELLLEKTIFNIRQKGGPPLLLPTSLLQLPRCLAWTYNLTSYDTTLFELDSFEKCNCSRKNISANLICFANVGCSPTPRQHF